MLLRPVYFSWAVVSSTIIYFTGAFWINQGRDFSPDGAVNRTVVVNGSLQTVEDSREHYVTNATLGFEKILAIGLPERFDRRDALTLMSSYQEVKLDWQDAIKGEDISQKAWPAHWNTGEFQGKLAELGCWRSHVNALRRVVEAGWSSALIIEDDADWDVDMKSQLQTFANKTRSLGNTRRDLSHQVTSETPTRSPYGDDWDLLWLGTCAVPPLPESGFEVFTDEKGEGGPHYLYYARGGIACTYGYAVTNESARSLLGFLLDVSDPVDFAISRYCEHYDCIVVWPELIGSHKSAGRYQKDSDIGHENEENEGSIREKGETPHILNSAILDTLERVKGPLK